MKKLKSQNGAIAIIVLVSVLFLTMFLISSYMVISNKLKTQKEVIDQTRQIYENYDLAEIYNSFFNNGAIPIYSNEQYFKIGSNEKVIIPETGGKYYDFVDSANYILMNDLSINKSDYSDINWDEWQRPEEKLNGGMIDYNGHTIEFTEKAKPLLPDEYQRVEYLQTSGGSIDTGLYITDKYQIEMKAKFDNHASSEDWLFGDWNAGPARGELIGYYRDKIRVYSGPDNSNYYLEISRDTNVHTYKILKDSLYIDDLTSETKKPSFTELENMSKRTLKIFRSNHTNSSSTKVIYYAKMWDLDDNLVRNFIPCYRKTDKVAGMYDLVEDKFYTGTGTFIYGPEVLDGEDNFYTKVQYIEGTGVQYIDTLYKLNSNSNVSIEYKLTELDTTTRGRGIFGCYEGPQSRYEIFARKDGYIEPGFYNIYDSKTLLSDLDKHTIVIKNGEACLDNNMSVSLGKGTFEQKNTAYLFHFNSEITDYLPMKGRIYSAKIWDGEEIVRDLVPCYRNYDNTAGMYDMVENIFYTNSGTGTFLYGPEV